MSTEFQALPSNLPVPTDDGACNHLSGAKLPNIALKNAKGVSKRLHAFSKKFQVFYFYPMTGKPNTPLPPNWNNIAGARGCTPQLLSFTRENLELTKYNAEAIGISSQKEENLAEAGARLGITGELLSDENLLLTKSLSLPTFEIEKNIYIKRITLIVKDTIIEKCFYPIFPPDKHIFEVLNWLKKN
jgi:peroxiredoxin